MGIYTQMLIKGKSEENYVNQEWERLSDKDKEEFS